MAGVVTAAMSANPSMDSHSILNEHNDCAGLVLNSRRTVNANANANNSGMASRSRPAPSIRAFDPVATPFQHFITEEAPFIAHMKHQH